MLQIPNSPTWLSVGWLLALLVLLVVIVLAILGQMDQREALLIGALALARLL